MEFEVYAFGEGICKAKDTYEKDLEAIKIDTVGILASRYYDHVVVKGEGVEVRISENGEMTDEPRFFPIRYKKEKYSILAMFDNISEVYPFPTKAKRDEVYEKLCTISTSAASAKPEAEQTDTTASSDETSGSKSTSTSKRTSNGSATIVTWRDLLTLENIGKSFGTGKYVDTGLDTWPSGSKASHSKPSKTFLATVLKPENDQEYPSFNANMKKMIGKTYRFSVSDSVTPAGEMMYKGKSWFFLGKWLDTETVIGTIKKLPNGLKKETENSTVISYNKDWAGITGTFTKCHCGCGTYSKDNVYVPAEWIDTRSGKLPATKKAYVKADIRDWHLVGEMKSYPGSVHTFTKTHTGWKDRNGFYWSENWLDFNYDKTNGLRR